MNFWGNQGILNYYDAHGEIYHECEPCQHGSMCFPTNWTGKSEELIMLSPNFEDGGLFDGLGRPSRPVSRRRASRPVQRGARFDGRLPRRDRRVGSPQMWVYTQDDNPRTGRLYLTAPQPALQLLQLIKPRSRCPAGTRGRTWSFAAPARSRC